MDLVASTFLQSSKEVQDNLTVLTLHPESGMSQTIRELRYGTREDFPVLYFKSGDRIVAWLLCTAKPRFYWNTKDHPDRPEVQVFVHPIMRRQGIGKQLIQHARMRWGAFSTCPWDSVSNEFFKAVGNGTGK